MAQTKTKPKKRSTAGKATGGSKNASRSPKAGSGSSSTTNKTKRKSTSSKAKPQPKSKSKSRSSRAGSSSRSKSSATKRSGGSRGKKSSQRSSGGGRSALETMKVPATVAGAAMLAVAGGLAARNGNKGGLLSGGRGKLGLPSPKSGLKSLKGIDLSNIDLPKPEEAIDWVEEKAKGVGDAGYRVAELSSQARSVRKAVSGKD
jgi:hypothetical protein